MLDMGFMPQLRKLFEVIPPKRQNLLFSATFSGKIEEMSHEFLTFPVRVEVTPQATTVENVEQYLYRVPNLKTKLNLINYLLKDEESFQRVIIFCRTKVNAEEVYKNLKRVITGPVRILHSDKAQSTRINTLESSKSGEVRVLISTDVAARGIDFVGITHVINFELPPAYEDYVHRIGRTARASFHGVAISLIGPADYFHLGPPRTHLPRQDRPLQQGGAAMIIVTSSTISGMRIVQTLGLVTGNTVRCKHAGKDLIAFFRNLVGGEVPEYTKMLAESREQSLDRMALRAEELGANAVVDARFTTSSTMMRGAAELLAYGTAVIVEPE
jgi:uncharacterized protein YbjQ (UPF0145 family)